jgi:hypothetical protein
MDLDPLEEQRERKFQGAKRPVAAPNGPEGQRRQALPEKLRGVKTAAAASLHPVKATKDTPSGSHRPPARPRKSRADAGSFKVSARDIELLRFVGEQYAITLPQLARLMGRSHHAARWLRSRWPRAGWVEGRALLVGEPVFLWLTGRGRRLGDSGYASWRPNPGRLAHIAAVTDVRLHVQERRPEAEWTCERELAREQALEARGRGLHLPDAVVWVEGRAVAVEVELTQKKRQRTERIVRELAARYDSVWYFAADKPGRALEDIAERVGGGRVQVLPLPEKAER